MCDVTWTRQHQPRIYKRDRETFFGDRCSSLHKLVSDMTRYKQYMACAIPVVLQSPKHVYCVYTNVYTLSCH